MECAYGHSFWRDDALKLFYQLHAGDGFEVLVYGLFAVSLRDVERIEDLQRLARLHRPSFRIERTVGGEDDLLQRIELEPGLGRRHGGEGCGVGPEVLLEVIEWALLQALAQRDVVLVGGARPQHVPARPDAAFQ